MAKVDDDVIRLQNQINELSKKIDLVSKKLKEIDAIKKDIELTCGVVAEMIEEVELCREAINENTQSNEGNKNIFQLIIEALIS